MKKKSDEILLQRWFAVDHVAYIILLALGFLLPIFFVPSLSLSLPFAKSALMYIGVAIAFILFVVMILRDGKFELPKHPLFVALGVLILAFIASSFFSSNIRLSLFGYGFEQGTAMAVTTLIVMSFLVSQFFRSKQKIFQAYFLFFLTFVIIAIFHISRFIIGVDFLDFGQFSNIVDTTLGSWNDLGIFAGLILILSFVGLENLDLDKPSKIVMRVCFVLSLLFLVVVNLYLGWIVIGLLSLIFFVYTNSWNPFKREDSDASDNNNYVRISYLALVMLLISFLFILPTGSIIGSKVSGLLGISTLDVYPGWDSTLIVAKESLSANPVFGSGPNRFGIQWAMHRPQFINTTFFWNNGFAYGVGLIPTFIITTGILGLLAWLAFLGLFVYTGMKSIFLKISSPLSRYFLVSSFLAALYLWIMSFIYTPGLVVFALAFFFTGLVIASLYNEKVIKIQIIEFSKSPKFSFLTVMILVVLLMGAVAFGYVVISQTLASIQYQKALVLWQNSGSLDDVERSLSSAIETSASDVFYRGLAEVNILKLQQLISSVKNENVTDDEKLKFQQFLARAEANAVLAKDYDPHNFENWLILGRVYLTIVPLGVDGAYENSAASYNEARKLNPNNPFVLLESARLEVAKRDFEQARFYIRAALERKRDYTDAIFLLSQIEVAENNLKAAISIVEAATFVSPDNPQIFFQLGLLKYNDKNYTGAISAFEKAVSIIPSYSNARYFLGLSYEATNRSDDAIEQFEKVLELNPGNSEIQLILNNLKLGREPFANVTPPLDDEPEKRSSLPIKEE